eukprot:CAMPEP_0171093626 /NCGR_PEP_ID=MMETSP0766_2-20121228/39191_1 /TAXON_ID=439317 /ORGANISM="Gambierdiscus australes, Strain CAWD 149" /LENGTH=213 /DNA_ID=CAMNT_0011552107 /DNA_START=110 /DNA_END=751 /DNA_ORIENTATION=+
MTPAAAGHLEDEVTLIQRLMLQEANNEQVHEANTADEQAQGAAVANEGTKEHAEQEELEEEESEMIPLPYPMPVGIFPVIIPHPQFINTSNVTLHRVHSRAPTYFWKAKDDPEWRPQWWKKLIEENDGELPQHPALQKKTVIGQCEDIKNEALCADSLQLYGLYCMGWGGDHCLPRSGAKCSDLTTEEVCHDNPWDMICVWSHKGCNENGEYP